MFVVAVDGGVSAGEGVLKTGNAGGVWNPNPQESNCNGLSGDHVKPSSLGRISSWYILFSVVHFRNMTSKMTKSIPPLL